MEWLCSPAVGVGGASSQPGVPSESHTPLCSRGRKEKTEREKKKEEEGPCAELSSVTSLQAAGDVQLKLAGSLLCSIH